MASPPVWLDSVWERGIPPLAGRGAIPSLLRQQALCDRAALVLPARAAYLAGLGLQSHLARTRMRVETCLCEMNKRANNCFMDSGICRCTSIGSNVTVSCDTLTSKCLLMKAEMAGLKSGRREKPKHAFLDNDGIYDPECDNRGIFKARQCNNTNTCWCVNTAGVRRTDKGDTDFQCPELVRTNWIMIETRHATICIAIYIFFLQYEKPYISIDLKQNTSQKSSADVDIADVAYYFEKEIKGEQLFRSNNFNITVGGEPLQFQDTLIFYIDEKPPEFSMSRMTPGLIAVIVVVLLAIVAGIVVLVITRRKRGKYEKAEVSSKN
uniref:Epithelial cell adhesion molecule n=1 Tax=Sphenodon punctatus TaxID=8508 RepID=A0A8D0HBN3_SPHPU